MPQVIAPLGTYSCSVTVFIAGTAGDVHMTGLLDMPISFEPTTSAFEVTLSNADGVIYNGALQPGDLVLKGRKYGFKDKLSKAGLGIRDGLYKVQLKVAKNGLWKLKVRSFTDSVGGHGARDDLAGDHRWSDLRDHPDIEGQEPCDQRKQHRSQPRPRPPGPR